MNKAGKVALILGILAVGVVFFVIPTMWLMKTVFVWYAYWRYVDEVSNLTGLNRYLVTAVALLMFIPFWFGAAMTFSLGSRRRRYLGMAILLGLAALYNSGLFWATRGTSFAFSGGAVQKWYALTPAGVRLYDRPGVDPSYGIPLKPVTPDVVRKLELLRQGDFKSADPNGLTFFNPITGEAQAWYYRYPDGTIEFYDKPGYHPLTGTELQPVTRQIVLEWRKTQTRTPQAGGRESGTGPQVPGETRSIRSRVLQVRSDPKGAETYLDWKAKGVTPVFLEGKEIGGLLVVTKEGRQAAFRRINAGEGGEVVFSLPPEGERSRSRLLLTAADGTPDSAFAALKTRLVEEGFTVLGLEEAREFQRELGRAGALSHPGFRAWARAKFNTDLLVTVRFQQTSRELSDQEFGYLGIRETVKGTVRAEVNIALEVVDLRSGDQITAASITGSSFAIDRTQGLQKALTQAVTESSKVLRQRIRG